MPTRVYKVNGKRVPSVTTILSQFKDPGPLMHWAWKVAYDVLEESTRLLHLHDSNGGDGYARQALFDFLQSNPLERANFRSEARKAADAGTIAHRLVDLWIHATEAERSNLSRNSPEQIASIHQISPSMARDVYQSFHAFLSWVAVSKFQLVQTEIPLVSNKHRFGGTIDCVGTANMIPSAELSQKYLLHTDKRSPPRAFVLCDWKTSKGLYIEHVCQIAAYGLLWDESSNIPISCYHLLRFDKETADFHHHQFADLTDARRMFLLLREAYDLANDLSKRIK